jgi:two-component system sensor histidine kinase SenX3
MRRSADIRRRLDSLRARLEPEGVSQAPSASVDDATERLVRAFDAHESRQGEAGAMAERLVSALDVIPQGIVLTDGSGRVAFRNRVAHEFTAARHSDALVERAIDELIQRAVEGHAETRVLELYGPPRRSIQVRAVPLEDPEDGGGRPGAGGAFLVVEDVSERLRLDAVRRDFVANISHELKTPVGALGLLAETLAFEDDPEVVHRLAAKMQHEAFRVSDTIDDLLQLSQIEAGEPPTREPVPVDLVVADAVDRTRSAAELREVRLVVDLTPAELSVVGDRRQLVSAVANLCDNAVKYSDPGSAVTVSAHRTGPQVEIDVVDQGIGIPASDLDRVFERFYRVDRARSRDTGGTGLGLAIVRHVAHNHAGEVTVASREGEGSTFTLKLPAA